VPRLMLAASRFALFVIPAIVAGCSGSSADPPPLVDAGTLKQTEILPYTEGVLRPDKNYVYCATFQIAWDQMRELLGGTFELEGDPPLAIALNRGQFDKQGLSPASYLATAGRVQDGINDRIRREMQDRFPHARTTIPEAPAGTALIAYAYLSKTLAFGETFDRRPEPLVFHSGNRSVKIASFGFRLDSEPQDEHEQALERQVKILSYHSADDFVLELKTKSRQDELILAKIPPGPTLAATIAAVRERIQKHPTEPSASEWDCRQEPLAIPLLDFNVRREYAELIGKQVKSQNLTIDVALQDIFFRLDETGARLESQADLTAKSAMRSSKPSHRVFVFDRPFLLVMQERGAAAPYFVIWVGDPEVLVGT
jgi:Serpin (serine protease inhibitor)